MSSRVATPEMIAAARAALRTAYPGATAFLLDPPRPDTAFGDDWSEALSVIYAAMRAADPAAEQEVLWHLEPVAGEPGLFNQVPGPRRQPFEGDPKLAHVARAVRRERLDAVFGFDREPEGISRSPVAPGSKTPRLDALLNDAPDAGAKGVSEPFTGAQLAELRWLYGPMLEDQAKWKAQEWAGMIARAQGGEMLPETAELTLSLARRFGYLTDD